MQIGSIGAGVSRAHSESHIHKPSTVENGKINAAKTEDAAFDASQFDIEEVAKSILGFVRTRVESAANDENNQADLKEMAVDGITTGFAEAKEVLSALGRLTPELEERIDQTLATVVDEIESGDMRLDEPTEQAAMVATTANEQRYRNTESLSLSLQTNDGDKIELNISRSNSAYFSQLQQQDGDYQLLASQWGLSNSEQLGFSIKGNLDQDELAAFDDLLGQVQNIADKFFNEEYDQAFKLASELGLDGEQFKSLDLNMRETTSYAASAYQSMADSNSAVIPKGLHKLAEISDYLSRGSEYAMAAKLDQISMMQLLSAHPKSNELRQQMLDSFI